MKLVIARVFLVLFWLGGLLLYVSGFSETDRAGGAIVKAAAWLALAAGPPLGLVGVLPLVRRPASR
jgi:hypothetical protein